MFYELTTEMTRIVVYLYVKARRSDPDPRVGRHVLRDVSQVGAQHANAAAGELAAVDAEGRAGYSVTDEYQRRRQIAAGHS